MEEYRKRLLYKANYRGTKEADILFGGFAREYLHTLSKKELNSFEKILDESDDLLLKLILSGDTIPYHLDRQFLKKIIDFANGQ